MKWNKTINIKPLLNQANTDDAVVAKNIANLLEKEKFEDAEIIERFRTAETQSEVNHALDHLYDYCDEHRIWLGFM